MCPGSNGDTEPQRIINGDNLISIEGDYNTTRSGGDAEFFHGFLRWLRPVNVNLEKLPLNEVREEATSLGKIACPIIMTTLLLYSRSVISVLFLSHLGKIELAGGSLALGFANITGFSVLKGLALGMDPICCQAYGAKKWSVLSQTYQKAVCLLLFVAIPISILWLNVEPIFLQLGQDAEITNIAKLYLLFCIPELIGQVFLHPMRSFLRTQGLTSPLTIAAIGAVILHAPINYLLVVNFNLGVRGVALALACNTINLNISLLIYVVASKETIKPWNGITILSIFHGWWPLLSLALPTVISVCLEWWWYEIMLFLCGLLSNPEASVAATGILIQTAGLFYSFPFSLSSGLATRVGHALGAGQPSRAQCTAIIGIILASTFAVSVTILTTAFSTVWGKFYTDDPQVLALISIGLPILGLCELGNSPQTAACGILTGTARPKDGALINLCSFYLVGLPIAILLTFKLEMGYSGLWFGLLAAQFSCVAMMLYTLIRTDWKHQAKRAEELTKAVGDRGLGRDELESGLLFTTDNP